MKLKYYIYVLDIIYVLECVLKLVGNVFVNVIIINEIFNGCVSILVILVYFCFI